MQQLMGQYEGLAELALGRVVRVRSTGGLVPLRLQIKGCGDVLS